MNPETISTFTDAVAEEVMIRQNHHLDGFYPVISLHAPSPNISRHLIVGHAWLDDSVPTGA